MQFKVIGRQSLTKSYSAKKRRMNFLSFYTVKRNKILQISSMPKLFCTLNQKETSVINVTNFRLLTMNIFLHLLTRCKSFM